MNHETSDITYYYYRGVVAGNKVWDYFDSWVNSIIHMDAVCLRSEDASCVALSFVNIDVKLITRASGLYISRPGGTVPNCMYAIQQPQKGKETQVESDTFTTLKWAIIHYLVNVFRTG